MSRQHQNENECAQENVLHINKEKKFRKERSISHEKENYSNFFSKFAKLKITQWKRNRTIFLKQPSN